MQKSTGHDRSKVILNKSHMHTQRCTVNCLINARMCRTQTPTNRRAVDALLQQSEKCLYQVENYFNRQAKHLLIGLINKILHTYEGTQSPVLNIYSPPTFRCILSPLYPNYLCRAKRHADAIQQFDVGVLEKGCN